MHDKFTDRVRRVMFLAREEAARLHHDYIGTEHLLLGIVREGEGLAATIVTNLGIDLDVIRRTIESMVPSSSGSVTIGEIPFTPRAKRVLELSGLYHACCGGETSWFGFARQIFRQAAATGIELAVRELRPIPSSEYPVRAVRPHNSRLSCERLERTTGVRLPDWDRALEAFFAESAG